MPLTNGEAPQLLTLPGEIKNKIWGYCLNNYVGFLPHEKATKCRKPQLNGADIWHPNGGTLLPNPHVGLLLTCKSIYDEVKDLEGSTALVFCSPDCADEPVKHLHGAHATGKTVSFDELHSGDEFILSIEGSVQRGATPDTIEHFSKQFDVSIKQQLAHLRLLMHLDTRLRNSRRQAIRGKLAFKLLTQLCRPAGLSAGDIPDDDSEE